MSLARFGAATVLAVAAVLATWGCTGTEDVSNASRLNRRNFEKIRPEMAIQDVVGILGEPTSKSPLTPSGNCTWEWREGSRRVTVVFQTGGHVLAIGRNVVKHGDNLD